MYHMLPSRSTHAAIWSQSSGSAREICSAVLEHALANDSRLRDSGEGDLIDDKTAFIMKRSETS